MPQEANHPRVLAGIVPDQIVLAALLPTNVIRASLHDLIQVVYAKGCTLWRALRFGAHVRYHVLFALGGSFDLKNHHIVIFMKIFAIQPCRFCVLQAIAM